MTLRPFTAAERAIYFPSLVAFAAVAARGADAIVAALPAAKPDLDQALAAACNCSGRVIEAMPPRQYVDALAAMLNANAASLEEVAHVHG